MSVSLVEFLKNGRLGPIGPGDVFKLDPTVLGEPDGESEYFGDRILKFGDLQVSVSKGIITALSIHLRDEPCEFPPGLGVTDFTAGWLGRGTAVEEASGVVRRVRLEFGENATAPAK